MKKNSILRGFTLTEILIVIAILGIMASLALPRLMPQTERARASEAIALLSAIRQGEEARRLDTGAYSALTTATDANSNTAWQQIGIENPNVDPNGAGTPPDLLWNYNVTVAGNTFLARATRTGNTDPNGNVNDLICLDQAGAFSTGNTPNNHPFSPSPLGGC